MSKSYVIGLLDLLAQEVSTADELLSKMEGKYPFLPRTPESIEDTLGHLQGLGLLQSWRTSEGGRVNWALVTAPKDGQNAGGSSEGPPIEPPGEGNGRSGGVGGGGGGGSDGPEGGGGRGLSEVLVHPILFSVAPDAQEDLIRSALGLPPSGGKGEQDD